MTQGGITSWAHYLGERNWDNWFVLAGRTRDSGPLEESNFKCMLKALGGEGDDVFVYHVGHWAVGWIEGILINPANVAMVKLGDKIQKQLENYPIMDEDHFTALQYERHFSWCDKKDHENCEVEV